MSYNLFVMDQIGLIGTILVIHFFAWLTPGPNVVLIVRNSLIYSQKTGIWTALGIAISNFIHIAYILIGLAFLSTVSVTIFTIVKFFGVGYLIYLGIKTFQLKATEHTDIDSQKVKDILPLAAVRTGFLTNIFSPKAPPFFLSIFGGLVASHAPFWVILFLWIAMPVTSFIMASVYSVFLTQKKVRAVYIKYQQIGNKLLGIAMIILAFMLAFHK